MNPEAALRALAEHGLRCDMNPTHDMSSLDASEEFWHRYLRMLDANVRQLATNALETAPSPLDVHKSFGAICELPLGNERNAAFLWFSHGFACQNPAPSPPDNALGVWWILPNGKWLRETDARFNGTDTTGAKRVEITGSAPDSSLVVGPADSSQGEPVAWLYRVDNDEPPCYKVCRLQPSNRRVANAFPVYAAPQTTPPPSSPQVAALPSINRASPNPGGMECQNCGVIFVGDESRSLCGVCSQVANDCVIVPRELTAENGAKAALIGEFVQRYIAACPECDGEGDNCHVCEGSGTQEHSLDIDWTTIKEIWKAAVAHFAAAPQSAPKAADDEPLFTASMYGTSAAADKAREEWLAAKGEPQARHWREALDEFREQEYFTTQIAEEIEQRARSIAQAEQAAREST